MASNPFPDSVRREAWNLLRPFKDNKVALIGPFTVTVGWVLERLFGYDRGA